MEKKVLEILARACDCPALAQSPGTELLDSGLMDSLALLTLLNLLEDELGLELSPTDIPREALRTPGDIVALVQAAAAEQ